jgi:uncharacterized protein
MTADDPQAEILAFMGDPAAYGGGEVKRVDTHAASVFLVGAHAYKIKRAVRYPFLDFSTLAKRKAACEAELEINRTFAPDIYRRVVPITREADGRLALGGAGAPVEWAVEMRRFDETATLDHLAERGAIDLALADTLARVVARAHDAAPIAGPEPWTGRLAQYLEESRADMRKHPELFDPGKVDHLFAASHAAWQCLEPLLRSRASTGLVRRGHGDLHLGNIVLIDGKPVVFDAIEFDPLIATGDVLYDLAFLLMDLVERGLGQAANVVLNRYLAETGRVEDLEGLAALPLFLSVRAAIRAKVTAAKLDVSTADLPATAEAARTYFRFALRLIAPPPAMIVAIGGLSGTGKSTLARALAPLVGPPPGAVTLRSDVERKAVFGMVETERLPASAFAADVTQRVYAAIADKARRVTAAGHAAIVDAVFGEPVEREQIAEAARSAKVPFVGLFLTADLPARIARVDTRAHDASDATAEVVRRQESYDLRALDWAKIDAGGSLEQTVTAARAALARQAASQVASHAPGEPAPR